MNKLKYFAIITSLLVSSAVIAQTQKIGHMDMQYVLSAMPEMKQVQSQLKTLQGQLEKQAEAKQKDFEEMLLGQFEAHAKEARAEAFDEAALVCKNLAEIGLRFAGHKELKRMAQAERDNRDCGDRP